jgi:hypothetical protein
VRRHVITLVTGLVQLLLAQGVGIGTSTPHPSAILELSSTTKGLLIPRLTDAERQALPDPATGLLIFNTTTGELNFYNGSSWRRIPSNAVSAASGTGTPSGEGVGIVEVSRGQSLPITWDGTKQGQPCPEGVYTYILEVETLSGKRFKRAGTVTLIR